MKKSTLTKLFKASLLYCLLCLPNKVSYINNIISTNLKIVIRASMVPLQSRLMIITETVQ